jgi:hypothetical protein
VAPIGAEAEAEAEALAEAQAERADLEHLHEDMLLSLMAVEGQDDISGPPAPRRLQFGIPGVRIPGVGGFGGIWRYARYATRAARMGANVVRQTARTAQELDQVGCKGKREGGREGGGGGQRVGYASVFSGPSRHVSSFSPFLPPLDAPRVRTSM